MFSKKRRLERVCQLILQNLPLLHFSTPHSYLEFEKSKTKEHLGGIYTLKKDYNHITVQIRDSSISWTLCTILVCVRNPATDFKCSEDSVKGVLYLPEFPNVTLFTYKFKLGIKITTQKTDIIFMFMKLEAKGGLW